MDRALQEFLWERGKPNPLRLQDLAAWYDVGLDASTTSNNIRIDASNKVVLLADQSYNSRENALVLPGVASNYASFTALTAFGTGDFSVSTKCSVANLASLQATISGQSNAFSLRIRTDGIPTVYKNGSASPGAATSSIAAFQVAVLTYVRSGTTGTFYINGVSSGSITDSSDYSGGQSEYGSTGGGTGNNMTGKCYWFRIYSAALNSTQVASDANGIVQSGIVLNQDFSTAAKLATSVTASTGQTVTINQTAIALPARIHGARDLYMGTAASQPTYLAWSGTNYGWLNGASGNYFSSAKIIPTGSWRAEAKVVLSDWTPAALNTIGNVHNTTMDNRSWRFAINTGGNVVVVLNNTGLIGDAQNVFSSVVAPFSDGVVGYVAADVDLTAGTVDFEYSTDGATWIALGTQQSFTPIALYDATANLEIGSANAGTASLLNGKVYYFKLYQTGTIAKSFDASDYPLSGGSTFVSSATGETWTVNGGATIVDRTGILFDGTDDYMKSAAFSLSQPENVYFVGRQVTWAQNRTFIDGNSASNRMRIGQKDTPAASPQIAINSGGIEVATNSDFTLKTSKVVTGIFNGASSLLRVNRGTATTGDPGSNAANGITLGASYDGANPSNIFVHEILIYDKTAHGTATQDRIIRYAARKWRIPSV